MRGPVNKAVHQEPLAEITGAVGWTESSSLAPLKRQAPEEDTSVGGGQPAAIWWFCPVLGRGLLLQPDGAAEGGGPKEFGLWYIDFGI